MIIRDAKTLHQHIEALKIKRKTIGFVPTMGALHAGHLSLVEIAQANADHIIVSIFVNPTQFGPTEDFARYPRDEEADIAKLVAANDVYLPGVQDIYPNGAVIEIKAGPEANMLCGAHRPGHFDGVVTVVRRLFLQVQPDVAVFGEKDFQQLMLIRQMVKAQHLPVNIIGAPIMRESDGLALSSRNRYLLAEERALAPLLYQNLQMIASDAKTIEQAKIDLGKAGFMVEYLEVRDEETLQPTKIEKGARIFIAARLGKTRLIDNLAMFADNAIP